MSMNIFLIIFGILIGIIIGEMINNKQRKKRICALCGKNWHCFYNFCGKCGSEIIEEKRKC